MATWLVLRPSDSPDSGAATTATVASSTVKKTVGATGTITPLHAAELNFSVAGTVSRVYVAEGDTVSVGTKLAQVETTALIAARTAASAQLDAARQQLSTDLDADASAVQIAADRAAVATAEDAYDAAVQAVKDATLTSTISGTVTSLGIAEGDVVAASGVTGVAAGNSAGNAGGAAGGAGSSASSSSATTAAVSVASTRRWLVEATVASADVAQVKKGLQAEIAVTGVDGTVYGTVESVGLVAQTNNSGAAVFPVTIKVTGERDDLFSATSAMVSIVVKQTTGITVATAALKTDGETTYVTTVKDGRESRQVVTVGEAYGAQTVITDGLAAGDEVVVPGFARPGGGERSGGDRNGREMPDFSNLPPGGFGGGPMPGGAMPPGGGFTGGGQ